MGEFLSAAMALINEKVEAGLTACAEDLALKIAATAPVGRDEPKTSGEGSKVIAREATDFEEGSQEYELAAFLTSDEMTGTDVARVVREARKSSKNSGRQLARLFKYTSGPNKGKSPDVVKASGRSVRGYSGSSQRHGRLKRGIHAIPAVNEGTRTVARVRSDAPYSYYVEYGLGKGGHSARREANAGFFSRPFKELQHSGGLSRIAAYVRDGE